MDQSSGLNISDGILNDYAGQSSDIIIPEGVKGISTAVFKDYDALRSIMLPYGLEVIDSRCFEGCSGLKTVRFPDTLTTIGKYAFAGCSSLVFHKLPAGLTSIGTYAFKDCESLKSIELPASVDEIGVGAFSGCTGLHSIRIPGMQTVIKSAFGSHAFTGCDGLKIYAPLGSAAEKFALDNGISVVNISPPEAGSLKSKKEKTEEIKAASDAAAAASAKKEPPAKAKPSPAEKAAFTFKTPEAPVSRIDKKPVEEKAVEEKAVEEKTVSEKHDETVTRPKVRDFGETLKQKQKDQKEAAEKARLEKKAEEEQKTEKAKAKAKADTEQKKTETAAPKPKEKEPKKLPFSRKMAVIILVVVAAACAGAAVAHFSRSHKAQQEYTLTLEDYINSNEAAKQQLIESVEDTDVILSVSGNTLIYIYDLSSSNSMTPEIAKSDELKESLAETLDANDEQFSELCAGLEKDTGISGVSVEVVFQYGNQVLLTRTYTSEGKQQ